ncbi:MAG: sugar phosphate isomerase/epimerase family protein [bacterium]
MDRRQFVTGTLGTLGAMALARPSMGLPLSDIKLGIINSEICDDFEESLQFIKSYNLKWVEVKILWGKYNTSQDVDTVKRAKDLIDKYELRVPLLATGFFKRVLPPPGAERDKLIKEQHAVLRKAIENARIFGTDKIRAFAFTVEDPSKRTWDDAMKYLEEAAHIAESEGVYLAVENVFQNHVETGADVERMLHDIPSPHLGVIWEPNNAARAGDFSPLNGLLRADTKRILDVHLRDGKHDENGVFDWCAVGDGELDVTGTIEFLRAAGYTGPFTLETHYTPPGGTKKDGSKRSIEGLLKIVESL